ncbi:MAG: sulfotransferase [bacterium]|nr:sulfotransferase [bacterium]
MSRPPVIVIGMHRSGTSLVTRVLEELGLFMGWRKESNDEAWFFQRLNIWLLAQAGGSWECPGAIQHILGAEDVRRKVVEYLELMMSSPRVVSYLGVGRYVRVRTLKRMDEPWGWKDPRNTFTLPLWLEVFPGGRVINVERHGVDVAESLRRRHEWGYGRLARRMDVMKPVLRWWIGTRALLPSGRCKTLEGGFTLWEEYMREARKHVEELGERAMGVRYEDFLAGPEGLVHRLCEFCGLSPGEERLKAAVKGIKRERAYAYREQPELVAYAEEVKERLAKWGY